MITLRSSGFWSLTLGFFLLMQSNDTPIPPAPGQEVPVFSNQMAIPDITSSNEKVSVSIFENPGCSECHAFALNTVVPLQQWYEHNPLVDLKIYPLPQKENREEEGEETEQERFQVSMAKHLICAEAQDQLWPLYYEFHAKEGFLSAEQAQELILEKELEINMEALKSCLDNEETQNSLEEKGALAEQINISLFPSTLIQDVQFIHSQPLENLIRSIDKAALKLTHPEPVLT